MKLCCYKKILCRCTYLQDILIQCFSGTYAPFELTNLPKWNILLKKLVSSTTLKLFNRILCNFIGHTVYLSIFIFIDPSLYTGSDCLFVCLFVCLGFYAHLSGASKLHCQTLGIKCECYWFSKMTIINRCSISQ